jgi:hypothetical protein
MFNLGQTIALTAIVTDGTKEGYNETEIHRYTTVSS